jgi:hypothetical protein
MTITFFKINFWLVSVHPSKLDHRLFVFWVPTLVKKPDLRISQTKTMIFDVWIFAQPFLKQLLRGFRFFRCYLNLFLAFLVDFNLLKFWHFNKICAGDLPKLFIFNSTIFTLNLLNKLTQPKTWLPCISNLTTCDECAHLNRWIKLGGSSVQFDLIIARNDFPVFSRFQLTFTLFGVRLN